MQILSTDFDRKGFIKSGPEFTSEVQTREKDLRVIDLKLKCTDLRLDAPVGERTIPAFRAGAGEEGSTWKARKGPLEKQEELGAFME